MVHIKCNVKNVKTFYQPALKTTWLPRIQAKKCYILDGKKGGAPGHVPGPLAIDSNSHVFQHRLSK